MESIIDMRSRRLLVKWDTHMSRTDDSTCPVAHEDIVAILKTVRARAIADTLLALLELFEETEVPGN